MSVYLQFSIAFTFKVTQVPFLLFLLYSPVHIHHQANHFNINYNMKLLNMVCISGSSKGFSAWEVPKGANYYYVIVDAIN